MRALDSWPSRGVPEEPLAWLIRVARNALVSHFRRITPTSVDPALLDLEASAFSTDAPEVAAAVNWALARLRPAHAELIEAFHFDERSVRDIAQARGLSERAVEGQLRRARLKLKKHLQPMLRSSALATREDQAHAKSTRTSG
jgi:RNA polymerase sigma factor (sigma-70 family)